MVMSNATPTTTSEGSNEIVEALVNEIRGHLFESDEVADHMHQHAAMRAARGAIGVYLSHLQASGMVIVPREPTGAMWTAGEGATSGEITGQQAEHIWQAMIGAALIGGPPKPEGQSGEHDITERLP